MSEYRIPTPEELYALEQQARRVRARELSRFLGAASRWVKAGFGNAFTKPYARRPARNMRHA